MADNKYGRRDVVKTGAAIATGAIASLAGCGSIDSIDETSDTHTDNSEDTTEEPQLQDVNLMLEPESDTADFTENEEYALSLEAELTYTDGSTESREVTDYEVENAEVRKTSEDGKSRYEKDGKPIKERNGYGVFNGIGENLEFTEFTDEDLKKAGHLYELEDIEIQDGQIILESDDLITGYSQIDLNINIEDEEISQYIDKREYQNIIQVNKPEEQGLQDLQVQGPEAIELWQKYREKRAETKLNKKILASSNRFENYDEFQEAVRENVKERLDRYDNPTIQDELGEWGTEFGRLYMEAKNGAGPSGGTQELASILAEAVMFTSDINVIPGIISDQGHNSNPVYVPGSIDPRDEEYWEDGKTYNVNTKREEAVNPPGKLSDYASGKFGIIFKRPEELPRMSEGTFDSFMELSQEINSKGHDMIDADYAVSLTNHLADDTEKWHENLQHIMETAVGNLLSTEHDLIPTGDAETPEVELR